MNRIIANFLKPSGPLGAIRKSVGAEKSGEVPDGPPRLICAPPIASRGLNRVALLFLNLYERLLMLFEATPKVAVRHLHHQSNRFPGGQLVQWLEAWILV